MKEVELKRFVKCPHCGEVFVIKGVHKKKRKVREKDFFEKLSEIKL